jgi:uncharacterized protein (DUF305 family)
VKNTTALSVIFISLIVGVMIGYYFSPEYQMTKKNRVMMQMELGRADYFIDLRYINGMIAHHQSAIYLLRQAQQHSQRSEVQSLADSVISADEKDIEVLYQTKKEIYNNTKPVTLFTKIELGENNETFDLRLLNALIEHHAEAIEKAKEVRTKSTRTATLDRADTVIQSLSTGRTQLEAWRKEWYGI